LKKEDKYKWKILFLKRKKKKESSPKNFTPVKNTKKIANLLRENI